MRILTAGALLMTMGCTNVPPEDEGIPTRSDPSYTCNAEGLSDLVGRPATQELGAEALRRSGSKTLRWIRPGDVVTMDYREDRLNVHLDEAGRVERLRCG